MDELVAMNLLNSVNCLITLPNKLFSNEKPTQYGDYVTLIQFYSLFENVFRNVVLLPHIPAYRTINKDCGRYRSFMARYESYWPFEELQFHCDGSNLLTYRGTDRERTVLYALTCTILCRYYVVRLEYISRNSTTQRVPRNQWAPSFSRWNRTIDRKTKSILNLFAMKEFFLNSHFNHDSRSIPARRHAVIHPLLRQTSVNDFLSARWVQSMSRDQNTHELFSF